MKVTLVRLFGPAVIAIIFTACGTKAAVVSEPKGPLLPLIEMIYIPGGTFEMGSRQGTFSNHPNPEFPVHPVTLRSFSMGKYEVTQGQYFEITGLRPSNIITNAEDEKNDNGWKNLPVENVNWYDALVFCNKLSIREKLNPVYRINGKANPGDWGAVPTARKDEWDRVEMLMDANGYRLPTEAEWEYAARGGAESKVYNPERSDPEYNSRYAGCNTRFPNKAARTRSLSLDDVAWHFDNSGMKSHEVGKKQPNEIGLHDMSGNVMEWCWDWLEIYSPLPYDNPVGPPLSSRSSEAQGQTRVIRGGAFSVHYDYNHVAYRHNNQPQYRGVNLGFRVTRWE
jgi:formylglycine-generating enzyme required for sulfatase activity